MILMRQNLIEINRQGLFGKKCLCIVRNEKRKEDA